MKPCTKCNQIKDTGDFYKDSRARDGLTCWCGSCINACKTAWRKANPEKVRAWQKANQEKVRAANRAWNKANLAKFAAYSAKRRSQKLKATPPWLSKSQLREIQSIYINCPKGYHVDHIIPLQGKNVKGLHVPWNLKYLLASDNIKKGNRI